MTTVMRIWRIWSILIGFRRKPRGCMGLLVGSSCGRRFRIVIWMGWRLGRGLYWPSSIWAIITIRNISKIRYNFGLKDGRNNVMKFLHLYSEGLVQEPELALESIWFSLRLKLGWLNLWKDTKRFRYLRGHWNGLWSLCTLRSILRASWPSISEW